jgi:hypothetical protein
LELEEVRCGKMDSKLPAQNSVSFWKVYVRRHDFGDEDTKVCDYRDSFMVLCNET